MPNFKAYSRIDGISDQRRLPRVGKIRLGVKRKSSKGVEYPSEVSYFVVRDEDYERRPDILASFRKRYGETPTELDIMFPVPDELTFFPQAYKRYGAGGLRCKGDGVTFTRVDKDTGEISEGPCPCPEGCDFALDDKRRVVCKRVASLVFLIPEVTWGGVFQIDTTSFNAIVDINSAIDYCRQVAGRIHMIPLKLRREARETQYQGKKATHYPMTLALPDSGREIIQRLEQANKMRGIFDVFQPAAVPQIRAPGDDVPEDLYPRDTVRKATQALPPPRGEPADALETEDDGGSPDQQGRSGQRKPAPAPHIDPGCIDCGKGLSGRHKKFEVEKHPQTGEPLYVCLACHRKREDSGPAPEPDDLAAEVRRQHEARTAKPEPVAAIAGEQQDLLDDFGF